MCMTAELSFSQRLMAESRHMGVEIKVAADRIDELEANNAKLRELCKEMHHTLKNSAGEADQCEHCQLWGDCSAKNWTECEFDRNMRELGIMEDEDE